MSQGKVHHASEAEARELAEASREKDWKQPSFLKELFLGNFRLDLMHPFPLHEAPRPEFAKFYREFVALLDRTDSVEMDRSGEYPEELLRDLSDLGAFGMKIPKVYGGLGFSNAEYQAVMEYVGRVDGNVSALLSAHQSIGVPNPLKLFGSEYLKKEYLPRCAAGEISAFALTEHDVGSDPARLTTSVELSEDGKTYTLNGTKLWCTNGTIASLLVVMARHKESGKISAFVVETDWEGVSVDHRCHFMGLRALANAVLSFKDVKVPVENMIGKEGRGLKIALTTLNDGRLSIPNGAVGAGKEAVEICREFASERVQWGRPVGKHEAVAQMIANMASKTFAMESIVRATTSMADAGNFDIRLEAAACKLWNTEVGWDLVDDTMQVCGGKGYETEESLAERGVDPVGVERMMRDFRINRIFEGSSEIMHLFMAREAVDKHLDVAGALIDPKQGLGAKLGAFGRSAAFYAVWYPTRWLGWGRWPRYASFGELAGHARFVDRRARKLARQVFHGMIVHQGRLQNKQGFLFRLVDIANELFAMTASTSRAVAMKEAGDADAKSASRSADIFCRGAQRRIDQLFHDLWHNDDVRNYRYAVDVLEGRHLFVEEDRFLSGEAVPAPQANEPEPEVEQVAASAAVETVAAG